MEVNPKENIITVKSTEPFGKLLLELMHGRSIDERILHVQYRVGAVLVEAYIDSEITDLEKLGPNNFREILHTDVARDLAMKAEVHARNSEVPIEFYEEHFDGLIEISNREVRDLPNLRAELEVVSVAAGLGYVPDVGFMVDDQDISMVQEEIEQAEAAELIISIIRKLREGK